MRKYETEVSAVEHALVGSLVPCGLDAECGDLQEVRKKTRQEGSQVPWKVRKQEGWKMNFRKEWLGVEKRGGEKKARKKK